MFELFVMYSFNLVWLAMFYGVLCLTHKLLPKGFYIAQILFLYFWMLSPHLDVSYFGYFSYEALPIFWFVASLMFVYSK
ncbi:hypothetical protein [Salsuginibacillus kocurii]|uniref:hypothetical protein n=1 Tax=Salsuginibacillus kocurii TaxID=427078 RepID=UPI0003711A6F|nr:hypothetical protein [Salsuginibacillus kocurii]